ncbi:hypothetical protein DL762_003176 [Monosporascus cannonballus]|uniref:Carrier domain-containing protein n=1 Tax=Monosporascus cannonballus TaxID=155416 RepID=A0ABY0HBE2_9PEZI|nr:hypothetical protein DL762_003176 [Monosporascus cannonballus]
MAPEAEPAFGRRLMPSVLDGLVRTNPNKLYGAIPKAADVTEGFRDITVADIARCANFMAAWIVERFGRSGSFETLTYMGIEDFRGVAVFHAAVKCGYKLLLPSPRNTPATNVSLMAQTGSTKLLHAAELLPVVKQLQILEPTIHPEVIPSFNDMINSTPEHFAYEKGFEEAKDDPILVLHSSGSTGPPNMLPDGNLLRNVRLHNKLRAIVIQPSVIEQILQEPNGIDLFKDVEFVCYSGAPLNPVAGDRLSKVADSVSVYGSTETFLIPELALAREDWVWHEFNPIFKHQMRLFDPAEGTYEMVVLADETNKDTSAIHHNIPGVTEYHTKDLFTRHPANPRLFKYYGRRDNIIVLANGMKLYPVPLEISVQSHPSLKGAFVIGNGRTQAALLVEPREFLDEGQRTKFLEELWPLVERSNSLIGGQGSIQQGKIICAKPDKPFARTPKGTVIRKLSEALYRDELEQLYSGSSPAKKESVRVELKPTMKPVYELWDVIEFARKTLSPSFAAAATIPEDADFYAYGLDSVQTLEVVSNLRRNLQYQTSFPTTWVSPRTIYQNSTVLDLSRLLKGFFGEGAFPEAESELAQTRIMDEVVERYTKALPKSPGSQTTESPGASVIALVGSTGYLGSHVLAALLRNSNISRIYCLNRSSDAQERQEAALLELLNGAQPLLQRLKYMTVELGKPLLGLGQNDYDRLAAEVKVIVYNSWRLDFGLAMRSISSIAQMALKSTAPEAPVPDASAALNTGYAQSKLATERILANASRISGVRVSIIRVCQVGGPTSGSPGTWADQPWISALLRTAKTLKSIPSRVAPIDWVPVDTAAAMLHDLVLEPARGAIRVYNICLARPRPWEHLVDVFRERHDIAEVIPLPQWVKKLRDVVDPTPEDVDRMPALKLLDHYGALGDGVTGIAVATEHADGVSGVEIPVADNDTLRSWLRDWGL